MKKAQPTHPCFRSGAGLRLPRFLQPLALVLLVIAGCSLGGGKEDGPWDTEIRESEAFSAASGTWSPDGTKIAFTHSESGTADPGAYDQLWIVDLETQQRRRIAPGRVLDPDWSPDGNWFVFHTKTDPEYLFKISADGDSLVRLTGPGSPNPGIEYAVAGDWSPSGSQIAFTISAGDPRGVSIMNSDGSKSRILDRYGDGIAWFPNGERLIYVNYDTTEVRGARRQLYFAAKDGANKKKITGLPHSDYIAQPTVSPDGQQIAFTYDGEDTVEELYIMNADGTGIQQVTRGTGLMSRPEWSPDGQTILFERFFPHAVPSYSRLYLLDVETLEFEPLFPKK